MVEMNESSCNPYNPCITCGACCAHFRASFYWAEADPALGGTVPVELTEKLNDFRRVMKGTNQPHPRCVALLGEIGREIRCSIYELRSSVCRDFPVSWENGIHHDRCDQARIAWGLTPLEQPAVQTDPEKPDHNQPPVKPNFPKAA